MIVQRQQLVRLDIKFINCERNMWADETESKEHLACITQKDLALSGADEAYEDALSKVLPVPRYIKDDPLNAGKYH